MSGADGTAPASASAPDRDALAADYVLGTLEAWQSREVERAMVADPVLRAAVDTLEAALAPLAALAPPATPPDEVWGRVERELATIGVVRPLRRERLVRAWAIGASLAAAVFAGLAFLPRAQPPGIMTVLVSDRTQQAWAANVSPGGGLRLASIPPVSAQAGPAPAAVPDDRVRQLWALPPGATVPTSLALLPSQATGITLSAPAVRPVAGMLIEITLEPAGGSPTGRPTGPVLFIGRLVEAASS